MKIQRWTSIKSKKIDLDKLKMGFYIRNGGRSNMENCLKIDKFVLKQILMKNFKLDKQGRPIISKDDEWYHEDEWDDTYEKSKTK